MFKSARWRSEKNKIKAVFKLQFHATQVPQVVGDALMISVVPADVGRPTARLEKSAVRDGSCYWENPVCETVKFVQEPKTGKIHERVYHFLISNGSSKMGLVGEVSFDFADYAEATKTSCVSLPLKNSKSGAILHVSIQRMQENFDQREVEESEDVKIKPQDRSLKAQLSNGDIDESIESNPTEDAPFNKTTSHVAELNGNHRASSGSDITISSSESSSGLNTPRELGLKNSNMHEDPTSFLSSLSNASECQEPTANVSTGIYQEQQRTQWEWSVGSDHGVSTDDSTNSCHDTLSKERSQQSSDVEIEKLKTDLVALARQAEVSELELQTLRKQIVREGKRGQDLSREVTSLKEERDALKAECEKFKGFQKEVKVKHKLQFDGGDPRALLEELRQELNHEKDLNANLRLQLQKTQESNSELMLAVQDLDEILEQKNRETSNFSNKTAISENGEELQKAISKRQMDEDVEQKALEELVKEHSDAKEVYLLEQKIVDLYDEIEIYRRDKDELEMQMEQLALDYEILKQENHDISYKLEQSELQEQLKMQYECSGSFATMNELENQIDDLENELKKQEKEFSDSLATINELETHLKSLEEELEKQSQGFEADLEAVTRAKVEQEQRAIRAEEALRKTRWKNANTAQRLQEEFRRLSMQMASTFDANEKLAMKALAEASELRLQNSRLEEMLQKTYQELEFVRGDNETKLSELSGQINLKRDQIEQMLLEIENKSKQLKLQKKHDEEMCWVHSQEIRMLQAEIGTLVTENKGLSEQAAQREDLRAELEQMKTSSRETELLLQRENMQRNELKSTIALARKEAEKSLEELNIMRSLKDEKETIIGNLQSELETLGSQYNELRHSLFGDELEKEKLRKQVFQLKGDLKKKEDAFTTMEKKLKDSNGRTTVSNGTKTTTRNNKAAQEPRGSKELTNLREKIKLLEGQIKLKENALEKSTNSFLEKEKDLQNKIEELESRMEELNQNSTRFCEYQFEKLTKETGDITLNGIMHEEMIDIERNTSTMASTPKENGIGMSIIKSNGEVLLEKDLKASTFNTRDQGCLDELFTEMALLKERNKSMEGELKEMQERYSEISLKFAEVEGERQQLVMTVRNLKNVKKC
ncbi:hypothetical protein L1049_006659 [Liquidambar formosana]|uniref:C2 NT-type domain-containing protein n=1 Tax=Liquidambar formosana TaxID=63359 RepID=A0AAP0WUH0_LIQFO